MKKLAILVSAALVSGGAIAVTPEVDVSSYSQYMQTADNNSVILMQNTELSNVKVVQGAAGRDNNVSVVDMRLQSPGTKNDVDVNQDGTGTAHTSLVQIYGTSGGNDVTIDQDGLQNDSWVRISADSDNNGNGYGMVNVTQNGQENYSKINLTGSIGSKKNTIDVDQVGDYHESDIYLNNSDLNSITSYQKGEKHDSIITLNESDSNIIDLEQKGKRSNSEIYLVASSNNSGPTMGTGNGIVVSQSWDDNSYISMNNVQNSTVFVDQN